MSAQEASMMYARSSTISARPSSIEDGIAHVREQTMPALMEMPGCVGLSLLVDRDTGRCIATSSWENEDAMRSSETAVGSLRSMAAEQFGGSLEKVQEWDIAVLHREHSSMEGTCARCAWLQSPMGEVDQTIDAFIHTVLPEVEGMNGFCSASLFVDRSSGMTVGATAWDSREAMDKSRAGTHQMRTNTASRLGSTILDVQEFDLAIAHLRVPELV
jgi:quinol monooxygenase YgiN